MKDQNQNSVILLVIGNILFLIGVLMVNALANIIPIGGNSTGEVSDSFPSLFTPAGITFSIWGIIYLLLIMFSVYQVIVVITKSESVTFVKRIGVFFILSSLFNIGWIFAWHYKQILLSFWLILFILISLVLVYLRLRKDLDVSRLGIKDKLFFFVPFSIYLGWITVAVIANTSILLVNFNWDGFGIPDALWTIFVITAATVIGLIVVLREKDIFYALVLIWAFIGIIVKRVSATSVYWEIISAASIGALLLVIVSAVTIFKGHQSRPVSR